MLRKDVDTKVPNLLAKYDPQGNGTLSMPEFLQLQSDIIDTSTLDPVVEIHEIRSKMLEQEHTLQATQQVIGDRLGAIEQYVQALSQHVGGGGSRGSGTVPPGAGGSSGSGTVPSGAGFSPAPRRPLAPLAHSPGSGGSSTLPPSTGRLHE